MRKEGCEQLLSCAIDDLEDRVWLDALHALSKER